MAEQDYFLHVDSARGEMQGKDAIRLRDFDLSMMTRSRGEYATGRPVFEQVSFSASIDQSYPKLEQALATNETITKAVLTCRKSGGTQVDFLTITFDNARVTSCLLEGDENVAPVPHMEFKMSFQKVTVEYRPQKETGILGGAFSASYTLGTAE